MEKGSGRHSTLQGRERSVFNQTNTGTVSVANLGKMLRDRAERVWAFPSATMPSCAETKTETETTLPCQKAVCFCYQWRRVVVNKAHFNKMGGQYNVI